MKTIAFAVLVLFLASCSGKSGMPKDVLPREKMEEVLGAMVSAGEFLDGYVLKKDSVDKLAASSAVYSQVFQVYHVTKEEFDRSYEYYKEHPVLMKEVMDSLAKRLMYPTIGKPQLRDSSGKKILGPESAQ
jgi:hypothetical protein